MDADVKPPADFCGAFFYCVGFLFFFFLLLTNFISTDICSLFLSPKNAKNTRTLTQPRIYFCIYENAHTHTQAKIYMYCVLNNQLNCDWLLLLLLICSGIFYARCCCFTVACEINTCILALFDKFLRLLLLLYALLLVAHT